LYYHPKAPQKPVVVFFPAKGQGAPQEISESEDGFYTSCIKWYARVGEDTSIFLVDGVVSFTPRNVDNVKYAVARSPTCSVIFMEKSKNRQERWMAVWGGSELIADGKLIGIADVEKLLPTIWFTVMVSTVTPSTKVMRDKSSWRPLYKLAPKNYSI
jgi:hypothetical protein